MVDISHRLLPFNESNRFITLQNCPYGWLKKDVSHHFVQTSYNILLIKTEAVFVKIYTHTATKLSTFFHKVNVELEKNLGIMI